MKSVDLALMLEHAQRRVSRDLDRALRELGASAEQWRVLDRLADEQGRAMGDLAQHLDMNPPTMTKLIDRMVAAGWVQRIADETDNRRVLVFITDTGLALHSRLSSQARSFHDDLASGFTATDMRQLGRMLKLLAAR